MNAVAMMIDMTKKNDQKKDGAVNQTYRRIAENVVARRHLRNISAFFVKRRIDRESTISDISSCSTPVE